MMVMKKVRIPLTETQTPHVYTAIAAVMTDMTKEGIGKDGVNEQQRYKFRGIDSVYNALAPKLAMHGLCILPRVVAKEVAERETRNGGVLFYTRLTVEFDLVSAKDGSKHTVCTVGEAMDSGDKSSNKAMSAAYKYAAFMAFCIPTEGDNDADSTTHEVAPRVASFQPAAKPSAPAKTAVEPASPADDLIDLPEFAAAVKKLREAERAITEDPPPFVWSQKKGKAALEAEYSASRGRLYTWLTTKIDAAPALEELDDKSLMDLSYATAGL